MMDEENHNRRDVKELSVQGYQRLSSEVYRRQLKNLSLKLTDIYFYLGHSRLSEKARDLYIRFLNGEKVTIGDNIVKFDVFDSFLKDEESAVQLLKESILKAQYDFRAYRYSTDGKFSFCIKPDSFSAKISRNKEDCGYVVQIGFDTELQIFSPLPLIPLDQLETPFGYGGMSKVSEMMALRAFLEYGGLLKTFASRKPNEYTRYIAKIPDSTETVEKAFYYNTFSGWDLTPLRMAELLSKVGDVPVATEIDLQKDFTGGYNMNSHHRVWDKIIRDIDCMVRIALEGIDAIKDPYRTAKIFFKSMQPNNGFFRFPIPDKAVECVGIIEFLENKIDILSKIRYIIQTELIPLEKEMAAEFAGDKFPYGKRKKSMVARTLSRYLFRKIQADPLFFVDSKDFAIRECALQLMSV